jgi:hypothetical protein
MARRQHVVMSSVSATLAALLLAGCGGEAGAGTRAAASPSTASSAVASPAQRSRSPQPVTADDRACTGVQAVIGHLTADTAGWSPLRDPFDKAVAQRIRLRSSELARQAPAGAAPQVVKAVGATARAFTTVSTAMRSKDRTRVTRAINMSRVAYRELKRACPMR